MVDIGERESSRNRSLERALSLLSILEETGKPLTLTEISTKAQLQKPTVQRLLGVLERYGYAERSHNRYHLGPVVLPLAYSYIMGNELSRVALPVLQELASVSQETASLFVRIGYYRVAVQRVEGIHPLRYALPIGRRLPLHMGVGKVLAAALPADELAEMVAGLGEVRYARGETVSGAELLAEFARVREQGYALSRNEREMGVASVAAPVFDASQHVAAAISVAGSTDRIDSKVDSIILEVRRAAASAAERLGRL
ncbi:MAG TPA: IclR family transcriptional regulator [Spirochaetia bacterium]|nr:IclR family transcriptional regulator [Spirochaetia bacterium]HRZ65714.1 IclR family transcriptional regulator [Spirochaetia bacterium]